MEWCRGQDAATNVALTTPIHQPLHHATLPLHRWLCRQMVQKVMRNMGDQSEPLSVVELQVWEGGAPCT